MISMIVIISVKNLMLQHGIMGYQAPVVVSKQPSDTATHSNADMTLDVDGTAVDTADIYRSDTDEVHVTHGDSPEDTCEKHITTTASHWPMTPFTNHGSLTASHDSAWDPILHRWLQSRNLIIVFTSHTAICMAWKCSGRASDLVIEG